MTAEEKLALKINEVLFEALQFLDPSFSKFIFLVSKDNRSRLILTKTDTLLSEEADDVVHFFQATLSINSHEKILKAEDP